MKFFRKLSNIPTALSFVGMCTLTSSVTVAQSSEEDDYDVSVQQFIPAPGGAQNFNHIEGSNTLGSKKPSVGLYLNYAHRPLTLTYGDESVDLLRQQLQLDVLAAIGIGNRLQLGIDLPVTLKQGIGESSTLTAQTLESPVLGDIRIFPKFRLTGEGSNLGVALSVPVSLPTGNSQSLQGEPGPTVEPKLAVELSPNDRFRAGINLGYFLRFSDARIYDYSLGSEFTYGLALGYAVSPDKLALMAELFGARATSDLDSSLIVKTFPSELLLSARLTPASGHSLTVGAGPGLSKGYGTPVVRAFIGYAFTGSGPSAPADKDNDGIADSSDRCVNDPEDRDSFQDHDGCPDPDNDGDSILDINDKCPDKAEDKDNFEDVDGCPDPDNDKDGVMDVSDKCPAEKEDMDKFEDTDGCPDPDNDKDGILDATDQCPMNPEDKDAFEDTDGCPDPDNDKDGVADADDKCPNEKEIINGVTDEDGCPDKGKATMNVTDEKIEVFEIIYFDTNKDTIKPVSHTVLIQVSRVLKTNTQITKLRIDGYTDNVDSDEFNLDLSQRRAESVRKFLIEHGVDAARLDAKGFGESSPIAENTTEKGRAKNRRVEFTVTELNSKPTGR